MLFPKELEEGLERARKEGNELQNFYVGDSDITSLGIWVALAARYQMKRKGGRVFAKDDADVMQQLQLGIDLGKEVALDDVPMVLVTVHASEELIRKVLAAPPNAFRWK